jgi:uncharacterized protein YbjT (DUF2867 family)
MAAQSRLRVVMLGASGAVGGEAVSVMRRMDDVQALTLLNRRTLPSLSDPKIAQHVVDVLDPVSYRHLLAGHNGAVCTLGVGQPSKVSHAELTAIDKDAVIAFATACKQAGVAHFELLSSVAADPKSGNFYLRTKGELREALVALGFKRLSIFQPSVIVTPANRYDLAQGILLKVYPTLSRLMFGSLAKYRGIPVETLGRAMATNLATAGQGAEILHWPEIVAIANARPRHV